VGCVEDQVIHSEHRSKAYSFKYIFAQSY
jgi:hypothetical protein